MLHKGAGFPRTGDELPDGSAGGQAPGLAGTGYQGSAQRPWVRAGARGVLAVSLCLSAVACGDEDKPADEGKPRDPVTEPLPEGDPIDAPDGTWTWVPFPNARCMNDSPTGLGVRLHADSDEVLIVIQGGGACFNSSTCALVANPNGFNEAQLEAATSAGWLDEDDPDNPFRSWNKVFIPYCSGDIFSGNAQNGTGYGGRTQMGYQNMREFLTRLVPTFKDKKRVVLSGYSAGGFAATVNWLQAIDAWGEGVRVDVLNDSGPPLGPEYLTPCLQKHLAEVWNWTGTIPEGCTECDLESGNVTEPLLRFATPYTEHLRHGLISSTEDSVIKLFYSYGLNDCANLESALPPTFPEGKYAEGLLDLTQRIFAEHPGARAFLVESTNHVWSMRSPGSVTSNGVVLRDWIEDFLNLDSDWENVTP